MHVLGLDSFIQYCFAAVCIVKLLRANSLSTLRQNLDGSWKIYIDRYVGLLEF